MRGSYVCTLHVHGLMDLYFVKERLSSYVVPICCSMYAVWCCKFIWWDCLYEIKLVNEDIIVYILHINLTVQLVYC